MLQQSILLLFGYHKEPVMNLILHFSAIILTAGLTMCTPQADNSAPPNEPARLTRKACFRSALRTELKADQCIMIVIPPLPPVFPNRGFTTLL